MKIKTRRYISEEEKEEEQPLSPAARLFHAPEFNCNIISVMGSKGKIDQDVIIEGVKQSVIKHPRFSSKLGSGLDNPDEAFFFTPEAYMSIPKMQGKCDVAKVVPIIEDILSEGELRWVTEHRQFRHIFHCHREKNRKVMGMWMLLVHTVRVQKKLEHWFVVNGVLIRYSSREHALISGLYCHNYPKQYESTLGDEKFVMKYFGRFEKIQVSEVVEMVKSMHNGRDRIKMALLYFLSIIIHPKVKNTSDIDTFLLKVVDDLDVCKTFPWGRQSFLQVVDEIDHLVENFNGIVQSQWKFSGYIIPLECSYVIFPFSIISRRDPLEHLERAQKTINRKKNSYGAMLSYIFCRIIVKLLGIQVAATVKRRIVSNTTMTFSNMVGPVEEVSFYGHPITYFASSAYGHPHALTIHCQSYMNKMMITMIVDPTVISDPRRLCDDLEESLQSIKAAVQKRGSLRLWDHLSNRMDWIRYKLL